MAPKVLFVTAPNGPFSNAGEYRLLPDEKANGYPLWKQVGGDHWIYSGHNGMWIIGDQTAKDRNFQCSFGGIFNKVLHSGLFPDQVSNPWRRLDGDSFVEDEGIRFSTAVAPAASLRVVSPSGPRRCAGEYQLQPEEHVRGMPVWRQVGGKGWLYSGTNGRWIFGGSDAKEKNFECSRGVFYSEKPHGGRMPERTGGTWKRLSNDEFIADPLITVTVKPSPLYVNSPNGQQRCAGEYLPLADRLVGGMPIWEHVGGKCWLYSGSTHMWIIGGEDAKAKGFDCTRGVIYCKTGHGGIMMPDKQVGNWLRLQDNSFREDAAISISMKPPTLYVMTPNGQQKCAGEYRLVPGQSVNGHPVWRQRKGIFHLYSSRKGMWQLAGNEGNEADYQHGVCVLQGTTEHKGLMPDKMREDWSRLEGDAYVLDTSIHMSAALSPPAKLHVKSPNGQQRCSGEYLLVGGVLANGQPLWRQSGGSYWLYSGTNGMWIFGSKGAKERGFECSRGVIYSNIPHGGMMPERLKSTWARLDQEVFHEDTGIQVQANNVPRKRKAEAPAEK